jgi:hypothetical protein
MKSIQLSEKLHTNEYSKRFNADNVEVRLKEGSKSEIFNLYINDISLVEWLRRKQKKFIEAIRIRPWQKPEMDKDKSFKM